MSRRVVALAGGCVAGLILLYAATARPGGGRGAPTVAQAATVPERAVQIATWNKALAADPSSAIALGQLAALHLQRARETGDDDGYRLAEQYARKSVAARTDRNGSSFVTLGAALAARHEFAAADSVLTELVSLEPDIAEYRAILGEIKLERGDYDAARIAFDSLHRVRAHLSVAPRLARWYELTGRPAAARKVLVSAVEETGKRADLPAEQVAWFHWRAGDLDMRYGRMRGARSIFEAGLAIQPGDHRLLSAMAQLEALEGRPRKAIDYAERSIAVRLDPVTLGVMGDAYAALGDSALAAQFHGSQDIAAGAQPDHRASSMMQLDRGVRVPEILASAQRQLLVRRDIHGFDLLAWALHKSGRHQEARVAMSSALRLGTRDAGLLYHAGMIERALGDTARARFFLSRAIAINPRFHPSRPAGVRAILDSLGGR